MQKIVYILACFILVLSSPLSLWGASIDRVIAVVNDEVITDSQLQSFLAISKLKLHNQDPDTFEVSIQEREQACEQLIEDRLIVQQAIKEEVQILPEWIEQEYQTIVDRFARQDAFEESIISAGLTITQLKNKIREQILMRQIITLHVRSEIHLGPHQVTQYYDTHKHQFVEGGHLTYQSIRFPDRGSADKAYEELSRSSDLRDSLSRYHDKVLQGSLERGKVRSELLPVFGLETGELSSVLKVDDIYYIFVVLEKEPGIQLTFEQAYAVVYDRLYQQEYSQRLQEWVGTLKEKAVIKKCPLVDTETSSF